jgi:hypothetical protein
MTTLDDESYVARADLSDIQVYDVYSCNLLRTEHVPGLGVAVDMATCRRHRCVYVADQMHGTVHRLIQSNGSPTTHRRQFQSADTWPVGDKPGGLSVSSLANVLVACFETPMIKEFSPEGRTVRVIELSADFVNLTHAVELTADQFVVCHGDSSNATCRVCLVSSDGKTLKSYGGRRGSGRGQLDSPIRVAVCGFVFVADFGNRRILRLGPSLRGNSVHEVVSSGGGLNCPLRICLDDRLGRLYVVDNKIEKTKFVSGQIKVFSLIT